MRRILALIGLFPAVAAALEQTEWRHRQMLSVEEAGIVRMVLTPEVLDASRSNLEDVRVLDPNGRETAYLIVTDRPEPPRKIAVRSFRTTLEDTTSRLIVETGTDLPLIAVRIATPAAEFLKSTRLETSSDGETWSAAVSNVPLFRQRGSEQLEIRIEGRTAAFLRISVDNTRSSPIPFTGAELLVGQPKEPATVITRLPEFRREEFAGETLLSIDLGARNLPLASVEIESPETLFTRPVRITIREMRGDVAIERTLSSGTVFRFATGDGAAVGNLGISCDFFAPGRELRIHIANGDSPPIAVTGVRIARRPVHLFVNAGAVGTYTVLAGNDHVSVPKYDLSGFRRELTASAPPAVEPGPLEPNPGHRAPAALVDVALGGALLDPTDWKYRRAVNISESGFQELEIGNEVFTHAQSSLGDLRLVANGAQIPYILERTNLTRVVPLAVARVDESGRAATSRWAIRLPAARIPVKSIELTTITPLFERRLRIYERITDSRGYSYDNELANFGWNRRPEDPDHVVVPFAGAPSTGSIFVDIHDGDNPPIGITAARASLPVIRLLFRAEADASVFLYSGNPRAQPPRYDLALVADRVLVSAKQVAGLGPLETSPGSWTERVLGGARGGPVFWGALGLVVVVLLVVVAKLLPKPPAA